MTRLSATRGGGGLAASPDADDLRLEVPVVRPTIEEFSDFYGFMSKIAETRASEYGLVKVIPPYESWTWKMQPNAFDSVAEEGDRVIKPIKQYVGGRKGAYRLDLAGSKPRRVSEFQKEASSHDSKRPSLARDLNSGCPAMRGHVSKDAASGKLMWTGLWAATPSLLESGKQTYSFSYQVAEDCNEKTGQKRYVFTGHFFAKPDGPRDDGKVEDTFVFYPFEYLLDEKNGNRHIEGYGKSELGAYYIYGEWFGVEKKACQSKSSTKACLSKAKRRKRGGKAKKQGEGEEMAQEQDDAEGPTLLVISRKFADDDDDDDDDDGDGNRKEQEAEDDETSDDEEDNELERVLGFEKSREMNDDPHAAEYGLQFNVEKRRKALRQRDFRALENNVWATMSASTNPPIYGGDQSGTLFNDAPADSWNLNSLDTLLRVGFGDKQAKGISTSMLYYGMWRAMFAWHTEDMELNSINFVHSGAPKVWYSIPPKHAHRFEGLARAEFGAERNICPEFLRHKNIMVSPSLLRREKIPYVRAIQQPGEFMITFPRSYHGGFNAGFNVAEAVNFAMPPWIEHGRRARWCKCESWTFRMDVDDFVDKVRAERPDMLSSRPEIGDLIWLHYKEESAKRKRKKDNHQDTSWWLCRLRKGRRNQPFMAVPIDKDNCPYSDFFFHPDEETWQWPFQRQKAVMKSRPSSKTKKRKGSDSDDDDDDDEQAKERKAALTEEEQRRIEVRAARYARLQASRKVRLGHRFHRMLGLVKLNPNVLLHILASASMSGQVCAPRVPRTFVTVESSRLEQLERFKQTRKRRRENQKSLVERSRQTMQVLEDIIESVCRQQGEEGACSRELPKACLKKQKMSEVSNTTTAFVLEEDTKSSSSCGASTVRWDYSPKPPVHIVTKSVGGEA